MVTKRFQKENPDPAAFGWIRPANGVGFGWVTGRSATTPASAIPTDSRWLTLVERVEFERWEPLDSPTLFRAFSELPPTEEAFQEFANQNGPFLAAPEMPFRVSVPSSRASGMGFGISLTRLLTEHVALRQCVGLIDAMGRRSGLTKFAGTLPGKRIADAIAFGTFDALRIACRDWLHTTLNVHLSGNPFSVGGGPTVVRVGIDASGLSVWRLTPQSLLAGLWFQVASSLVNDLEFRNCSFCGAWMLISAPRGGRRSQTLYCSNACKVAAFRARQSDRQKAAKRGSTK